ncbi:MAG TPA: DUF3047 domain-containing protein [Candidatus Binatia bacterium]|nr:DUF3047 domain-containing protein [Candidatus Binatia bacterium]
MLPRPTIRHSALKTRLLGILIATLGAWTSPASAEDCKVLEDFSSSAPNEFPKDWTPRDKSGSAVYTVRKEDSRAFVRAHAEGPKAKGNGIEADRPVIWDIEKYPVLRWRWRARVFPTGADEHKGKEDSALGIYVGFCPPQDQAFCERSVKGQLGFTDTLSMTKALFSKGIGSLKYIWSERLPKGFEFERSRKTVKVLESGRPANPDQWVEEKVNVASDYRKHIGAGKLLNPIGLAILTDADDTQSAAEGDYADFRICTE